MGVFPAGHEQNVDLYRQQATEILQRLRSVSQCYVDFFRALQALELRGDSHAPLATLSTTFYEMVDVSQDRLSKLREFMEEFSSGIENPAELDEKELRILSGRLAGLGYRTVYDTGDRLQNLRNAINTLKSDMTGLSERLLDSPEVGNAQPDNGPSGGTLSAFQSLRQSHIPMWESINACQKKIEVLFANQSADDVAQNARILSEGPDLLGRATTLLANPELLDTAGKVQNILQGIAEGPPHPMRDPAP